MPFNCVSVADFMTPTEIADTQSGADPTLDVSAAFDDAWAAIKDQGGTLIVPPGRYLLNAQWVLVKEEPVNILIYGWGARLYAGASVTGKAISVRSSSNEYQLDIEGLVFDHRGNGTVAGSIEVLGGHCVHIKRCNLEFHSVRADYDFITFASIAPGQPGVDDYNSFWCRVEHCGTRKRSGSETGEARSFIRMIGAVNRFKAVGNLVTHCNVGVLAEPETGPHSYAIANGVVIEGNNFEVVSEAAVRIQLLDDQYGPTGWRIVFNDIERASALLDLPIASGNAFPHSQPPLLFGNYGTTGSVTDWVVNPSGYPVSTFETRFPGFGPAVENSFWQGGSLDLRFPTGSHLRLANSSGSSGYNVGHLDLGGYRIWVNTGNGKAYIRSGQPSSASDGTIIGTQS